MSTASIIQSLGYTKTNWQDCPQIDTASWHQYVNKEQVGGGTVYSSSGSTGASKSLVYTPDVFRGAMERTKEVCRLAPIPEHSHVAILWGYGLFPPAQFYTAALGEMGCSVYPLGSGKNLPTELKIVRLSETPVDVLVGMPSYLLKVGKDIIAEGKLAVVTQKLQCIITGGEVLGDRLRADLQQLYGVPVYDHYGMLQAPMIAGECSAQALHISREYLPEVVQPDGKVALKGKGTLLLSSAKAWHPLKLCRLKTNDIVELRRGTCTCGAATPTIKIFGRNDFVMKVRGQLLDFPEVFQAMQQAGIEDYYFEVIKDPTDTVLLHIGKTVDQTAVTAVISSRIVVTYQIVVHDTIELPQTNTGKAVQIIVR